MEKNLKQVLLVSFTLFVSGCSSSYVPPSDTDLVSITYKTNASPKAGLFVTATTAVFKFDSLNCEGVSHFENLSGTEDEPDSFTIQVPSGQPLVNTYRTGTSRGSKLVYHYVGSKFTPEKGHKYEVSVLHNISPTVKDVTVSDEQNVEAYIQNSDVCRY